jgi:hypothetical protein
MTVPLPSGPPRAALAVQDARAAERRAHEGEQALVERAQLVDDEPGRLCPPPEPSAGDGSTGRGFVISCLHCKRIITVTPGIIADAGLDTLRAHLVVFHPDRLSDLPRNDVMWRHFRAVPEADEG